MQWLIVMNIIGSNVPIIMSLIVARSFNVKYVDTIDFSKLKEICCFFN